ncbi:competence damage-inducible protein A [uncultured Blautia sp.]|nr:competence damage-inducible protein A [uncultured Blautia sp.]
MSHTAEIIAVGTEILLGNIANTDAQMLSQSLSTLGVNVFWHTVVGDNPQRLREALDIARHRADIIAPCSTIRWAPPPAAPLKRTASMC